MPRPLRTYSLPALLVFLSFVWQPVLSQDLLIKGKVLDAASGSALASAVITAQGGEQHAVTDSAGAFEMWLRPNTQFVSISLLGYENAVYQIPSIILANPLRITIRLKSKSIALPAVTVSPELCVPVVKDKAYYVLDFEIIEQQRLLVLTYELGVKGGALLLTDADGKKLSEARFSEEPVELFHDCLSNEHVVTEEGAYQIHVNDSLVTLLPKTDIARFNRYLRPCVAKTDSGFFFIRRYMHEKALSVGRPREVALALSYWMERAGQEPKFVRFIADSKMQELDASEYTFEQQKLDAGMYRGGASGHGPEADRAFAVMTLLKDAYAPLYALRDSLVLFNFLESKIEIYSSGGTRLGARPFLFEHDKYWKRQLLYDEWTGRFYTFFDRDGKLSVCAMDCSSGKTEKPIPVMLPFARKLRVANGFLYFIKSDNAWDGTKYLYRQLLEEK